jgi:hypothetical protein
MSQLYEVSVLIDGTNLRPGHTHYASRIIEAPASRYVQGSPRLNGALYNHGLAMAHERLIGFVPYDNETRAFFRVTLGFFAFRPLSIGTSKGVVPAKSEQLHMTRLQWQRSHEDPDSATWKLMANSHEGIEVGRR